MQFQSAQLSPGLGAGLPRAILGPNLRNVSCDDLLRLGTPLDMFLMSFADDVGVVITARAPELTQLFLNQVTIGSALGRDAELEPAITGTSCLPDGGSQH